jgi:hypothetical protein
LTQLNFNFFGALRFEFVFARSQQLITLPLLCSYGEQEQDEENLDDDEAAFDAPAVSGCAGSRSSTPHSFEL